MKDISFITHASNRRQLAVVAFLIDDGRTLEGVVRVQKESYSALCKGQLIRSATGSIHAININVHAICDRNIYRENILELRLARDTQRAAIWRISNFSVESNVLLCPK